MTQLETWRQARRRLLFAASVSSFLLLTAAASALAFQAQKNYKDRGEYDLFRQLTGQYNALAVLHLANTWVDKYPQSDYAFDRELYLSAAVSKLVPPEQNSRRKLDELAGLLHNGLMPNVPAAQGRNIANLDELESGAKNILKCADAAFAPKWKPGNITAEDWNKAKQIEIGFGHKIVGWIYAQHNDAADAKKEYALSLDADANQPDIAAILKNP